MYSYSPYTFAHSCKLIPDLSESNCLVSLHLWNLYYLPFWMLKWSNICQGNYCPAVTDLLFFTFSLTRRMFVFVEHFPNEGESHSPGFASFLVPFHPLQRMKLVRLCPPLPRQQTRVYWVHAGLTKSTDFPRTIRKRNKRQRGSQRGLKQ